jgi:rhodanese-related sulfurtransferase
MPTREIKSRSSELLQGLPIVTYCWGPGCNGATRAALELAQLGHLVREMLGGYEYWVREGSGVENETGIARQPVDPLTAPGRGITCEC